MTVGNWYKNVRFKNGAVTGECNISPEGAEIKLKNTGYSMYYISADINDIDNSKDIHIRINISSGYDLCSFFAAWYKKGQEIFKEYIKNDSIINPFEGSDKLVLSVLVRGESGDSIKIDNPVVTIVEKRKDKKVKVAGLSIPYGFVWEHKRRSCEDNLKHSLSRIDALYKSDKPDLIVLTENFYNRITSEKYEETFLSVDSPQIMSMRRKAMEHNVYIAFSFREVTEKGYFHNSALLIDRKGDVIVNYHKTHLTMEEKISGLVPGDESIVVDTEIGKLGIAVCWDLYYPEFVRTLAKKGAEIIINPSAGFVPDMHCLRAKENGVYIVTGGVYGHTTVVINPDGEFMATGECTGAAVAEINLNQKYPIDYLSSNSSSERRNVFLNELREDLYI